MAQLQRTTITSDQAPRPIGAYSLGMAVNPGHLVYVAGQVAMNAEGTLVGPEDAATQTKQVYTNIGQILAAAGATFNNVVEFTTYVVGRDSIQKFIEGRNQIYPSLYPEGDFPPNTLLVVNGLVREEFLVEIKAVAALP